MKPFGLQPHDLHLLFSLDAMLRYRNVTHAARRLNISQPALSAQLRRLRTIFGDPLLVPSEAGRGMVPTPHAAGLEIPLRDALDRIRGLGQATASTMAAKPFHIVSDAGVLASLESPLLSLFPDHHAASCRLSLSEGDALHQIEVDNADLVLGHLGALHHLLRTRSMYVERMVGIRRRSSASCGAPSPDEFIGDRHVVVDVSDAANRVVESWLRERGASRDVALLVPHYGMLSSALEATDALAVVPQHLAIRMEHGYEVLPLPFLPNEPVVMAWHRRHDHDARHRRWRDAISRACAPSALFGCLGDGPIDHVGARSMRDAA